MTGVDVWRITASLGESGRIGDYLYHFLVSWIEGPIGMLCNQLLGVGVESSSLSSSSSNSKRSWYGKLWMSWMMDQLRSFYIWWVRYHDYGLLQGSGDSGKTEVYLVCKPMVVFHVWWDSMYGNWTFSGIFSHHLKNCFKFYSVLCTRSHKAVTTGRSSTISLWNYDTTLELLHRNDLIRSEILPNRITKHASWEPILWRPGKKVPHKVHSKVRLQKGDNCRQVVLSS